ncbi:hypothetical protein [Natrinema amylolyticum]|uniref:hypothetical protein n=1 Tax=Natrinema amylolyticum TaxID=2878679 RepID=UPI001CFAD4FE|nr:hypothetical protein [Natrinema amylolyticum]
MTEFTDRLLILLIAAVGFGSLLVGWFGGFVIPSTSGQLETVLMGVLVALFVAILIGIWVEFNRVSTRSE